MNLKTFRRPLFFLSFLLGSGIILEQTGRMSFIHLYQGRSLSCYITIQTVFLPPPPSGGTSAGFFCGAGRAGGAAACAFSGVSGVLADGGADSAPQTYLSASAAALDLTDAARKGGLDVSDIAEEALPSVVSITNISVQELRQYYGWFGFNGEWRTIQRETSSCGSGVIVARSASALYIVTNYHVIEGARTLSVGFVDGAAAEAEVVGSDADLDLAVIKVGLSSLSADTRAAIAVAEFGDSSALKVGNQVVAIGNALGYGQSVTTVIVSAV